MKNLLLALLLCLFHPVETFRRWRARPFKSALNRAFSTGVINSYQLHELDAGFDAIGVQDRDTGYWEKQRDERRRKVLASGKLRAPACAILLLALCLPFAGRAQTNIVTPPGFDLLHPLDMLTNLPGQSDFTQARISVEAGALMHNGALENELLGQFYVRTNWLVGFGIENAPVSTILDSVQLGVGYRGAWPAGDISLQLGGKRTWGALAGVKASFQAYARFEASWVATTNGRLCPYVALTVLTPQSGSVFNQRPAGEASAGFRLNF